MEAWYLRMYVHCTSIYFIWNIFTDADDCSSATISDSHPNESSLTFAFMFKASSSLVQQFLYWAHQAIQFYTSINSSFFNIIIGQSGQVVLVSLVEMYFPSGNS